MTTPQSSPPSPASTATSTSTNKGGVSPRGQPTPVASQSVQQDAIQSAIKKKAELLFKFEKLLAEPVLDLRADY